LAAIVINLLCRADNKHVEFWFIRRTANNDRREARVSLVFPSAGAYIAPLSWQSEMDNALCTLESALPVVRGIADIAEEHGFDVALYSSVLRRERSESDLDLYFVVATAGFVSFRN
jgi:hypothetical protein